MEYFYIIQGIIWYFFIVSLCGGTKNGKINKENIVGKINDDENCCEGKINVKDTISERRNNKMTYKVVRFYKEFNYWETEILFINNSDEYISRVTGDLFYYDKDGELIDGRNFDSTHVHLYGLAPGGIHRERVSTRYDSRIDSVTVKNIRYRTNSK